MCSYGVSVNLWVGSINLHRLRIFAQLEPLSCLLLSEPIAMVVKVVEVEVKVKKVFYWSDSQITIQWICQIGKKRKCRIQNKVDTVREKVAVENWYYVPTKLNPIDISTRRAKSGKTNEKLWQSGPQFLLDVLNKWPSQEFKNIFEGERLFFFSPLMYNHTTSIQLYYKYLQNLQR